MPTPLARWRQDDLNAFANAAWRLGHANEAARLAERVYDRLVRTDPAAASMAALEVALLWLTRGDVYIGQGWMDRARRLLAGTPVGPTNGYLAYLDAVVAVRARELDELPTRAAAARDIGASLEDTCTGAAVGGRSGAGCVLRRPHRRRTRLRRAAHCPSVESGEVRLEWAGDVYGLLLHMSRALSDPSKMREWTESMVRWCGAHDALIYHRVLHIYQSRVWSRNCSTRARLWLACTLWPQVRVSADSARCDRRQG